MEETAKAKDRLWDRHKISPKDQSKYEIREEAVHGDGSTDVHLSLWHKVDSETVRIRVSVESGEVSASEESLE